MKKSTKDHLFTVLYHGVIIVFAFIMIYPLIWMVFSSFKPTNTIFATAKELFPAEPTIDTTSTDGAASARPAFPVF